jgi:hypothetical protein
MDRRAERDKHAGKEQRARAAAKNVSAKFVVRFHRLGFVEVWII